MGYGGQAVTGLDLKFARLGATVPFGLVKQADVARAMGVSRGRISQMETTQQVDPVTAYRYTTALEKAVEAMEDTLG